MNGARLQETRHRRHWRMASRIAGFPAKPCMFGAFTAGCKAVSGHSVHAQHECAQERRHQPDAEAHEGKGLVGSGEPWSGCTRVGDAWLDRADAAGLAAGLQFVCADPVPVGLRPAKAGRVAGLLPDDGLHGQWCGPRQSSNGSKTGRLEACAKNANGSPATGRYTDQTSRHGTNGSGKSGEVGEFVPPRDKTPCFSGAQRPATGHLSRLAISTVQTEGRY